MYTYGICSKYVVYIISYFGIHSDFQNNKSIQCKVQIASGRGILIKLNNGIDYWES